MAEEGVSEETIQAVNYIGKMIDLMLKGYMPQLVDADGDCYFMLIETEDEDFILEIKKDNRFGKNLNS